MKNRVLGASSNQNLRLPSVFSTFCVLPWMECIPGPTAEVKLCCIADSSLKTKTGKPYRLNTVSLDKVWNGYGIRQVRKKMLVGKKVKACSHCYYQKSIGQTSYRESCNKEWLNSPSGQEIIRRVEYSQKNDGRVDIPPLYFDFRWCFGTQLTRQLPIGGIKWRNRKRSSEDTLQKHRRSVF